ncbi:gliding motility-associated C-terminal domain-containing protein [Ancylomarina longa]|uniref:Gliding motility-associated C-terminal domain-containing protein n=1 Tax=Ancylomarina longa TaxID=2487017 RepID=A0A434AY13_9BACT|nr:gliding motility-associated C-terminal domain-containing protein [Ancylomarina longa]RUT79440.1 hypothetical protein DLK05_04265 [Ancylomarina longa]
MKMRFKLDLFYSIISLRGLLFAIITVWAVPGFSQISASNADFKSVTQYTNTAQDSIYVFCDNMGAGAGELKAESSDGTSGWTFTWAKWDSSTSDFTIPVLVENNQTQSILTNLNDGLYRVVIDNASESHEDQVWVLNNVNSNPVFNLSLMDCIGIHFTSTFAPVKLQYLDIPSTTPMDVPVEDKIVFSLTRNGEEIQRKALNNYSGSLEDFIDLKAFEGEKTFSITVIDQYGCVFISPSILSETYVAESMFSVTPEKGEAPLEVTINYEALNATDYEWFLYKDFEDIPTEVPLEDSLLVDGIILEKNPEKYIYLHPGNYFIKLVVKSDKGPDVCKDEFTISTPIVVDTSLVQVPNVFTPNGDGQNDVWRIKSQSLNKFHAIVFNRWGRVIFEWKNPNEGWNGKINGKWATPGTYFYVITATGREEPTKKYTKKGSFMLIRK